MAQTSLFTTGEQELRFNEDDPRLVKSDQLEPLATWLAETPELFVDYESTGLRAREGAKVFSAGFFAPDKGAKVADFRFLGDQGRQAVVDGLKRRVGGTLAFNTSFETDASRGMGFELGGKLWDPQQAAFAVREERPAWGNWGPFSQKALCFHEIKKVAKYGEAVKGWLETHTGQFNHSYELVPGELIVPYNCEDVELGWELAKHLEKQVKANGQEELVQTDSELGRVLSDLESRGIAFDLEYARGLIQKFQGERVTAQKRLNEAVGRMVDVNSHTQLFGLIYGELRLPLHKDQEKQGKLDDDVFEWMLSLPEVDALGTQAKTFHILTAIRDIRELSKLLDTYLLPWTYEWQRDGVIFPNINIRGARTRRFSADDPNMQNVPTRTERGAMLRKCFIARPGFDVFSMDESQAEYRAFTHYSRDPILTAGYKNQRDFDIHEQIGRLLGVVRKIAKHLNFGLLYGMGIEKLARKLLLSVAKAKELLEQFYVKVPGIKRLRKELDAMVRMHGYVRDLFGGRRHLKPEESYKALNSLCQMTVANLIRAAMVRMWPMVKKLGGNILLQVHDEVLFELPIGERVGLREIRDEAMQRYPAFSVPIVSDCEVWARSWGEAEGVTL